MRAEIQFRNGISVTLGERSSGKAFRYSNLRGCVFFHYFRAIAILPLSRPLDSTANSFLYCSQMPEHGKSDRSRWLPDYPDPPPGEWVRYDYGKSSRGWTLDCGPMFHADIGMGQNGYLLTLNLHPISQGWDVEELKRIAERHIVARVRKMIPAYRAIHGRARAAAGEGKQSLDGQPPNGKRE